MTTQDILTEYFQDHSPSYTDLHPWSYRDTPWGCEILYRDEVIGELRTSFPCRDGSRIVGVAQDSHADRLQVSDHGCGRKSVQFFRDGQLIANIDI